MGIGGLITSKALTDQLAYEALLIVPMAVVALALVATPHGRLGLATPPAPVVGRTT